MTHSNWLPLWRRGFIVFALLAGACNSAPLVSDGSAGHDGSVAERPLDGGGGQAAAGAGGGGGTSALDSGSVTVDAGSDSGETRDGAFGSAGAGGMNDAGPATAGTGGALDAGPVTDDAALDAPLDVRNVDVESDSVASEACASGATRSCASDGKKGTCATGVETCIAGSWSACSLAPASHDTCDLGKDDDCNGVPNEGCVCINGAQSTCGEKLGAKGTCAAGVTSCVAGKWGSCGVTPAAFDKCVIGNDDMCLGLAVSDVVGQRGFVVPNASGSGLPNPAKYADNGDGTVTDMVTGLLWEQVPNPAATQCPGPGGCKEAEAEAYCQSKGGHWRLPTIAELLTLVDYSTWNPAMDRTKFPVSTGPVVDTLDSTWTSTTGLDGTVNWVVEFHTGDSHYQFISSTVAAVRCVSATPALGYVSKCYPRRYEVQPDGVLDVATGLVWQQQVSPDSYTFNDANAHCAALGAGWRLPNIKELLTTVDYSTNWPSVPAINSTVFPGVSVADWDFFSSSKAAATPADAWIVEYGSGGTNIAWAGLHSSNLERVRCVR